MSELISTIESLTFYGLVFGMGALCGRMEYGNPFPNAGEMIYTVARFTTDVVAFPVMIPYNIYFTYKNVS